MVAAALLLPVVAAVFVVRLVAVTMLRGRHPAAAAFVERNWAWAVPVGLVVGLTLLSWPVGALAAALLTVVIARPRMFGLPPH